jgi:hypothetical protein
MIDLGTVRPGSTIRIPFSSFDKDDGASVTMTNYAVADILVYKDGSTTERASTAGYTATTDFDAKTGKHLAIIDLADNTTAGFWAAGSEYLVAIDAVTVDAVTTGGWIARFRIGYPNALLDTTIATLASQTSFTLTVGPAEDDALNDQWCIIHDVASAVQCGKAIISDYTGSTKTVTLAAGTTFTAAATDNISIMGPAPIQPTVAARKLDVSTGGEAGVDWANVGSPTTTLNLSGTTVKTATDVETDTADIQARLPAALVSGRMDASVGAMAANVMTAAAAAADLTTELQSGLATGTDLATVAGYIDTEVAAIKAVTDKLDDTLEDSGGGAYIFTSAALANAPSGGLDAAGVRAAVGLASANLDTQLGDLPTAAENTTAVWAAAARTLTTLDEDSTTLDLDATIRGAVGLASANLDTQIGDLPTNAELSTALGTADDAVLAAIAALNDLDAAGIRSAVGLASANLDTQLGDLPTAAENFSATLTTQLTESYAADGAAPTLAQAVLAIQQFLQERSVSGTTLTVKKLDGTTLAMTFTLDDGTSPTAITRAS